MIRPILICGAAFASLLFAIHSPARAEHPWALWAISTTYETIGAVVWENAWNYVDAFDSRALCEKDLGARVAKGATQPKRQANGDILLMTARCFPVGVTPRMQPPVDTSLRDKAMGRAAGPK